MQPERIGKRVARLRQQHGWTQQEVADRIAISRVAVSHIEMDLSVPSERTIALLAGLFKISPYALVEGTTYPPAKAERLPAIVCRYTELEMNLALLHSDLAWLSRYEDSGQRRQLVSEVWHKWMPRLQQWAQESLDGRHQELIASARQALAQVYEVDAPQKSRKS
jgi:transcriptional regulator with XRE-family HTH domain